MIWVCFFPDTRNDWGIDDFGQLPYQLDKCVCSPVNEPEPWEKQYTWPSEIVSSIKKKLYVFDNHIFYQVILKPKYIDFHYKIFQNVLAFWSDLYHISLESPQVIVLCSWVATQNQWREKISKLRGQNLALGTSRPTWSMCLCHRENGGVFGTVPLIINPIYTLYSGYLLDIYIYPLLKGSFGRKMCQKSMPTNWAFQKDQMVVGRVGKQIAGLLVVKNTYTPIRMY